MAESEATKTAPAPEAGSRVNDRKWTPTLMKAGWTVLPNVIFERQQALGLNPLDVNILLHIVSYWWRHEGKPFPSKATIAKAIGVDPRTIQRRIAAMEKAASSAVSNAAFMASAARRISIISTG